MKNDRGRQRAFEQNVIDKAKALVRLNEDGVPDEDWDEGWEDLVSAVNTLEVEEERV